MGGKNKVTLTEAGWCARCKGKWDDEPSGCKDKKKEKKKHCNYSSSDTSYPTSSPTSTPTETSDDSGSDDGKNKVTLTEAGWCARCKGKWDDEPSGCKDKKKEKKKH